MTDVPVTVVRIETAALTEGILEQIPILKPEDARRGLSYDPVTNRVRLETYDGEMALEVVGYVWRPDIVGHRACYWMLVKNPSGFLSRVHVFSRHSNPGDPPPVLQGMKQIFVVGDGDKEAGG